MGRCARGWRPCPSSRSRHRPRGAAGTCLCQTRARRNGCVSICRSSQTRMTRDGIEKSTTELRSRVTIRNAIEHKRIPHRERHRDPVWGSVMSARTSNVSRSRLDPVPDRKTRRSSCTVPVLMPNPKVSRAESLTSSGHLMTTWCKLCRPSWVRPAFSEATNRGQDCASRRGQL